MPPYAILSHTWELEEVAYKDWPTQKAGTPLKGYKKILGFRDVARSKYECNYGWVDTCCIDKSSSAELTEAINSMYAKAEVCIAFLADVQAQSDEIPTSRWMTRGWTLQELIAPSRVEFYDFAWVYMGPLSGRLAKEVEVSSGIPVSVLTKDSPPSDWSVAQRMSWASQRQTTRLEDEAYCLLGLFDVSLPLIYGEGERAFVRLQEEIIRSSVDHSIFAWHFRGTLSLQPAESYSSADEFGPLLSRGNAVADAARRLLAPSPAFFWDCGDVEECYLDVKGWVESYEMHNLGLGPIAINLKRTSQTSARLQHGNNVDLETTTFGVVRVNDMESTRFQCGASHLDRLSIAEEEALITTRKARVTILRICSPSITVSGTNSVRKTRLGSMRAPKSLRPFQPSRLRVAMTNDLDSRALRTSAIPQDQWDTTSHIWFTKSPVGAISFAWEQDSLELTFVFAAGTDRDVPFHMALLETSRAPSVDYANLLWFKRVPALGNEYVLPEDAYERWESRLDISEDSHADPLRVGQTVT
ncbi:hypothetical protein PRZ48_004766 [Zasmidium cellare]|uniref:Heterokaryon incompatibility domain-containing protein n=1 Tax=Zasmidium cellare TaxID=395010 RepID=A0ABR0EQG0_ZASCE|nr:hypothetical protein PRZ48_004766 [Zasmidium cellare]